MGGQDDDRDVVASAPQTAKQRKAIAVGKAKIEQDQRVIPAVGGSCCIRKRLTPFDIVSVRRDMVANGVAKDGVIFDQ